MADADSIAIPYRVKDLTGQRFVRLTVLAFSGVKCAHAYWLCRCECGKETVAQAGHLRSGQYKSCGCLSREQTRARFTTHGKRKSPEYQSWRAMIERCCNHSNASYGNYGGRGIIVCERWRTSFEAFYADMGPKPAGNRISIERLNNNGHYEPGNCKWATMNEQQRNTRNSVLLTFRGRTQCIAAWAEELGIKRSTLAARIRRGWSVERALAERVHR